jgi:hypothetical protein
MAKASTKRKARPTAKPVTRNAQIDEAVARLNDLYKLARERDDVRAAISAQRELDRLLLAGEPVDRVDVGGVDAGVAGDRLRTIERYLLPLGLVDQSYPVEEHARIAAEMVRRHGLGGVAGAGDGVTMAAAADDDRSAD